MSTYAIVTVDAGGNTPPALAIAAELTGRGHQVHVLGHERQRDLVASAAYSFTPLATLAFWNPTVRRSVLRAIEETARLGSDRGLEDEVRERVRGVGADAALVDSLMPSSLRGARRAGVPTAVLFHTFLEYWVRGYRRGPVAMLARLRGAGPLAEWNAADARIVTADPDLDPAAHRTSSPAAPATWVGAAEHGAPATPDASAPPLVVVSLSTTWFPGQTDAYRRIIAALGALPVRAIVTLGGLEPDEPLVAPPNVEVHAFARHDELFSHASLVIGHGGHSTTFRALAHGVPVILMPMHPLLDQPMIAAAVARAGAGSALPRTAASGRIAGAVTAVLADPGVRAAAVRIGERIRSTDAAAAAATALERLGGGTDQAPQTRTADGRGTSAAPGAMEP
jgi:UDP:flavonoid glycosyltransferase YjiC (YdhE family)